METKIDNQIDNNIIESFNPDSPAALSQSSSTDDFGNDIYCLCKDNHKDSNFIGCDNDKKCLSYLERLESLQVEGGSWFHWSCLGILKEPRGSWFCQRCTNTPKINLILDLSALNMELVNIPGDGNCMFEALYTCLKNQDNVSFHLNSGAELRKILMNKLDEIVHKYPDLFVFRNLDSQLDDPESFFCYKLANAHWPCIHEESICKEQAGCCKQCFQSYIVNKREPASERQPDRIRFSKYGSGLEMDLFCFVFQINIYLFQNANFERNCRKFTGLISNCFSNVDHKEQCAKDYVALLYENSGSYNTAHYSSIIKRDPNKPFPAARCRNFNYCKDQRNRSSACKDCYH